MHKRFTLLLIALLLLTSCASPNPYELTFTPDGSEELSLIYSDGNYEVYSMGGLMMCTFDGEPMMLEMALHESKISLYDILESAEKDTEREDMIAVGNTNGGLEYRYETFNMIIPEAQEEKNRVYFVPTHITSADLTENS